MDPTLKRIRERLLARRDEILGTIIPFRLSGDDDVVRSQDDLPTTSTTIDVGLGVMEMKQKELTTIREAIRRIDDGTYGTCSACGEGISPARLEALPHAIKCKSCSESVVVPMRRSLTVPRSTVSFR